MNEQELNEMLKHCSLNALLMLTSKALSRAGFGDVQVLDRRQSKQKTRYGGHELLCEVSLGTVPMRVIVKVINDGVRLRMLDELAGSVRRTNADLGLIVSPHELTQAAEKNLSSYQPMRLEALTGLSLAQLLSRYHIGTRSRGEVDYAFFGSLEAFSVQLSSFFKKEQL
jgi:hypothetical protein